MVARQRALGQQALLAGDRQLPGCDRAASLVLGEHPGDPDGRPARAFLEFVAEHGGLVFDRHRADRDEIGFLVPHDQDEVHVGSLSVGLRLNLRAGRPAVADTAVEPKHDVA
jgi:hypothetical protein